jgi:hypothetical protein
MFAFEVIDADEKSGHELVSVDYLTAFQLPNSPFNLFADLLSRERRRASIEAAQDIFNVFVFLDKPQKVCVHGNARLARLRNDAFFNIDRHIQAHLDFLLLRLPPSDPKLNDVFAPGSARDDAARGRLQAFGVRCPANGLPNR